MFGIFNNAFRIATRSQTWPAVESRAARNEGRSDPGTSDHDARHPRLGLRPGESWRDR